MNNWIQLGTNWDLQIAKTLMHVVYPKPNLNFPPVSLRNTRLHIIFPKLNFEFLPVSPSNTQFHVISMSKYKHKSVQWVWNSLKPINEEKNNIFWYFLEIPTLVFCIAKYHIISFQYVGFVPVQPVLAIKFRCDNYQYQFCNFKNQYEKNWYQYRACIWFRACLGRMGWNWTITKISRMILF